ncbi:SelT/SelW/SelH family protein [Aspergillus mulundensis]|uniref:Selenoprotein W family protein n=1 Tax=Aspergillus mulundensis TaxID=1810919 RepID=A0A3D8REY6_9EURO|nr:hypothetical protein DSM5745_07702 [Aspergillus mulundensis]RDW72530.1 hypothetical protein DSM5745_07702 [Aspergillus mulundensis]
MTEPTAPIETNPPTTTNPPSTSTSYSKPRITIQYCTQCKWMLRAAYFAQELLSTFGTDIGEIALVPRTGGIFTVTVFPSTNISSAEVEVDGWSKEGKILWDRKADGGFPEVKELKSRVRNLIDPNRDLGHTDRALRKGAPSTSTSTSTSTATDASSTSSTTKTATKSTSTSTGTGTPDTDLPPPIAVPASASDPASMSARAKVAESESASGSGERAPTVPSSASTCPPITAPTSASDPASLSAQAKANESGSGSGARPEHGTGASESDTASMAARARVVDHAGGKTGAGGVTGASASGPASLSAREKIVDETAGGTVRKSDGEVCEDCL